jgi:hypothetical protein
LSATNAEWITRGTDMEPTQEDIAKLHEIFDELTEYLKGFTRPPTMEDHYKWQQALTPEKYFFLRKMKMSLPDEVTSKVLLDACERSGWYTVDYTQEKIITLTQRKIFS